MKKILKIGAVIAASLTIAISSYAAAGGSLQSFGVTNCITYGTVISGWPTNSAGTNGYQTGGAINIQYADHFGICVQGLVVSSALTAASNTIDVNLVTSMANNYPTVTYGTNIFTGGGSYYTQNDWVTVTNSPFDHTSLHFSLPLTPGTNWVNFQTNIASTTIASDANWLGVYAISNNFSGFITNFSIGVNTKLLPRPLGP